MNYYEMLYIVSPVLQEGERDELIKKLNEFIVQGGGEVVTENRWGMRSLAYPIMKNTSGYYVLEYIKLLPDGLKKLQYFMKVNEGFIRSMVLRKDNVPAAEKKREEMKNTEKTMDKEAENGNGSK